MNLYRIVGLCKTPISAICIRRASGTTIDVNRVIFEDSKIVVMNKWSGILVQGNDEHSVTLLDLAKQFVKTKYNKSGAVFLGLVHRLDRVTSGLIVFARNSKSAAKLTAAFQERRIKKVYVCIVHNQAIADTGTCVNYLSSDASLKIDVYPNNYPNAVNKGLMIAVLHYHVLARMPAAIPSIEVSNTSSQSAVGGFSLLKIELETGRKHQIRAQLSNIGMPIVGDDKYMPRKEATYRRGYASMLGENAIALHSYQLEFPHPGTNEMVLYNSSICV